MSFTNDFFVRCRHCLQFHDKVEKKPRGRKPKNPLSPETPVVTPNKTKEKVTEKVIEKPTEKQTDKRKR